MRNNANLEFRKIKSLKYLYEVNENGTIFRNVKSKKQNKIVLDKHHSKTGYYKTYVRLNGKTKRVMIHKIVAECWLGDCPEGYEVDHIDRNSRNNNYRNLRYVAENKVLVKPVKIVGNGEEKIFRSMTKCAEYLGKKYNKTTEAIRYKLKARRHHIFDYDIIYLNAETRHTIPKG